MTKEEKKCEICADKTEKDLCKKCEEKRLENEARKKSGLLPECRYYGCIK